MLLTVMTTPETTSSRHYKCFLQETADFEPVLPQLLKELALQ